jgi:membrane protein
MSDTSKPWKDAIRRIPVVGVLVRAVEKSNQDDVKDMAASIAYFGFFSLFPLLVGVVAAASLFLDHGEIESRLDRMLSGEFPGSADFLRTNIEALIDLRGAAGVASVLGLFWSASKMFGAVSRGINRALGIAKGSPFYLSKLRYFAMTIAVSVLLLLATGVSTVVDLLNQFQVTQFGEVGVVLAALGGHVASSVWVFAILCLLYKLVPFERPLWRDVVPSALVTALLFELGKALFVFYVDNARSLQAVYGSLTAVIVLLLWLYFSARVLIFGAELIAIRQEDEQMESSPSANEATPSEPRI